MIRMNAGTGVSVLNLDDRITQLQLTQGTLNVRVRRLEPDEVFEEVKRHFSEKEIVDLTLALAMINLWNRIAISLRAVPGHYRAAKSSAAS